MADGNGKRRVYNAISMFGAALTSVSAVAFLVFFFLDLAGFHSNPYLGIFTFLVLPGVFVFGLLLIPVGFWRQRRRIDRGQSSGQVPWPTIDLRRSEVRRVVFAVVALTLVNTAIVAMASFKSVEYVDSTQFCASVCHTAMEPEGVGHRSSVHASISCTACHIGPGPGDFLNAKLGGIRRLAAVATGSYSRPVPAPVHDLPAAAGTCRSCHTADAYIGDVGRQFKYYADDETSTEQITAMTMRVGGGAIEGAPIQGIHWHASRATKVEYIATDDTRATIPWIRVTDAKGVREYVADGAAPETYAGRPVRVMDCTDCHNRQGHAIASSVERAVDDAIGRGVLPRSLPYTRREVMAALSEQYPNRATADREIADRLGKFFASHGTNGADPSAQTRTITAAQQLYGRNVFPDMNVRWGSYPNNIGHTDAPGCFRCHDDQHKTRTGAVISQDCESCHRMQ